MYYQIKVSKFMTNDESDCVPSATAIIKAEELHEVSMTEIAEALSSFQPSLSNLRAMTLDEINTYLEYWTPDEVLAYERGEG